MAATLRIPARFNGPLHSGNGGYCAGAIACLADEPVEVSLRRPVALETPLDVAEQPSGAIHVHEGDALVALAEPSVELPLTAPAPVDHATAATAATGYRGSPDGEFSRCFVCGLSRDDALGVFAGAVEGRDVVASPWTPPAWAAGDSGVVAPEIVSAVLDCPTYFAAYLDTEVLVPSYLVRFATRIGGAVRAGVPHVVMAWPLSTEGRKREAAAAVLSPEGEPLAVARALLVEPRAA